MASTTTDWIGGRGPAIERGAREALLLWGGGMLTAGLSLVGVGAGAEGASLALAGLFNVIYGIHTFGRLGPVGVPEEEDDDAAARATRSSMAWTGGLTALAGVLVALDHHVGWVSGHPTFRSEVGTWAVTAYGLVTLGLSRVARARQPQGAPGRAKPRVPPGKGKVEKRRRMDKSPPP